MVSFIVSIAVLILGYVCYGKIAEKVFVAKPERQTPVIRINDGVDYVALPAWKTTLIQLLNIAGTGPIFGAIAGALFGPAAFAWIVFGCIFAGAVHDYVAGMLPYVPAAPTSRKSWANTWGRARSISWIHFCCLILLSCSAGINKTRLILQRNHFLFKVPPNGIYR
jgi:carbon starvation protein CstA